MGVSRKRSSLNRHFSQRLAILNFLYVFGFLLLSLLVCRFPWVKDKKDAAMHPARPRSETVTQFPNHFFLFLPLSLYYSLQPIILNTANRGFLGVFDGGSLDACP